MSDAQTPAAGTAQAAPSPGRADASWTFRGNFRLSQTAGGSIAYEVGAIRPENRGFADALALGDLTLGDCNVLNEMLARPHMHGKLAVWLEHQAVYKWAIAHRCGDLHPRLSQHMNRHLYTSLQDTGVTIIDSSFMDPSTISRVKQLSTMIIGSPTTVLLCDHMQGAAFSNWGCMWANRNGGQPDPDAAINNTIATAAPVVC